MQAVRLGTMSATAEANAPSTVEFAGGSGPDAGLTWDTLPIGARLYVVAVIGLGAAALLSFLPRTLPDLWRFVFVLVAACLTSAWKLNLPIPLASGATLSVSYAADMMALLLLGPRLAVVIAAIGVWIQCTVHVKRRYPLYRTVFSTAAEALTMAVTGVVYVQLGGAFGPFDVAVLTRPLVAAIAAYFVVNTALVAGAIGLSSERAAWRVWRDDFAWSAPSFIVAGTSGAAAAVIIERGMHWEAVLLLAPVYLTYRTYRLFVGRLEAEKRHAEETEKLHRATLAALDLARSAERALAQEKQALEAARTAAESANRLKDQFLATVSHELRTPLNAILGWAEMLKSGALRDEKRDHAHAAIMNNARRQARLIEELLDVARIMSGKLRIDRGIVDVHEIVTGALETIQPEAEAKGVRILVQIDERVGAFYGDGPRLQQVLWNLLSNGVKFTPSGGTVSIDIARRGHVGRIVVSDTGCGIPPGFLASAFEPFRQADGSTTRLHGGLGLGLAIVKHLVEAHGGTVSVESRGEGLGTTFTIHVPLAPDAERERSAAGSVARTAAPEVSLRGLRVLVVDDDDESRNVVAVRLQTSGATVLTAPSASSAFETLERERVDVLLADIAMPDEDGYSLIRKLRSSYPPPLCMTPAAALTAFARDEDRQEAINAGFQVHLAKPVEAATLVNAVAALGRLGSI